MPHPHPQAHTVPPTQHLLHHSKTTTTTAEVLPHDTTSTANPSLKDTIKVQHNNTSNNNSKVEDTEDHHPEAAAAPTEESPPPHHPPLTAKVPHPKATTTALQSPPTNALPRPLLPRLETGMTEMPCGLYSCKLTEIERDSSKNRNCNEHW